jgi:beta-N-acetylhexosaminidase
VNSNPRNPVIADRSFGEDPQRVAEQVAAFVRGMQREGVAACVKHFPGHGDSDTDSHLGLPRLEADLARLEALEFIPFRAAVAAGVAGVMSAHIVVPNLDDSLPATLSRRVLELLRTSLGFGGVIFTDALSMRAIADRYTPEGAVLAAIGAGVDMPVHTGPLAEHRQIARALQQALEDGQLEPAALSASYTRISALAERYPAQNDPEAAWREGDEALLQEAARRALVRFGSLDLSGPLTLVAAEQVRASAASQATVSPLRGLEAALTEAGEQVAVLAYERATLAERQEDLLNRVARASGTVVFVSTARTRMSPEERDFARAVADRAPSFAHLALWNPYHVNDLPGPALVTFGFRERSLQAVAQGGEASGTSPVRLEPL